MLIMPNTIENESLNRVQINKMSSEEKYKKLENEFRNVKCLMIA